MPSDDISNYVPPEVGTDIYVGAFVSMIPIVWATYEFTSRCEETLEQPITNIVSPNALT